MATERTPVSLTFEQLKELIAAGKSEPMSAEQIAEIAATAAAKAKMPENKQHPGKSVFSHPEGELARPKDKLKCRMYIGGGPIEARTCTPTEIEALNRMTPGAYRVRRADESEVVLEVRGQVNANKELEKLWIVINAEDADKNGFGTLTRLVSQFTEANRVQAVTV